MPRTFGGTAEKRKPLVGTCSSPRRCSTIGTPAPSSVLWTGRSPRRVSSMFSESMPTSARAVAEQILGRVAR